MLHDGISRPKCAHIWFMFVFAGLATAQAPDLTYQPRGPNRAYKEGVRTRPAAFTRVDLLAALIDYTDPGANAEGMYHAMFYMPEPLNDLHLIVREADDLRYFYWLVRPADSAWQAKSVNHFDWSTSPVIRYLNYRDKHQLVLKDLGAIARVGEFPAQVERVLPVALYSSEPPQEADSYSFAFRPDGPVRLSFEVLPENGRTAIAPVQRFDHAVADQTQWIRWSAATWKDGWYRMEIGGYALGVNSDEVKQEVRFYHAHRLEN